MQIFPVSSAEDETAFYKLPLSIYKNDPNWIQPLDKDLQEVFDIKKNKAYRHGKLQRWILKNGKFKTIGRIAAFTNKKYKNKGDDVTIGGVGFFECINDQTAADILLDTAKHWLKKEGMEAMDGPINFGERDRWWGMVTKGFMEPLYCMNYNPAYYVDLFETYGFKIFFEQVCLSMHPKTPLDKKIWERHNAIEANNDFSSDYLHKKNIEKYAKDFATVYN
ncbi:MAG: hypothetical protein LH615_00025, partial [Ferruginibacter sp.]|nr:hypothetical protein [Ferruginibacter sp.]